MNQINFSGTDGEYPTTQGTIEFLQNAVLEALRGLGTAIGGSNYRLSGAVVTETDAGGGNKTVTWTEGFVLLSGEVYYVPDNLTGITGASSLPVYWAPVVTNDPVLDPAEFRDPVTQTTVAAYNVHNIRRAQPTLDGTAPGALLESDLPSATKERSWNLVTLPTGYANRSTQVPVRWRKRSDNTVEIEGTFLRTSSGSGRETVTLFTLPAGARPIHQHFRYIFSSDLDGANTYLEVYPDGKVIVRDGPTSGDTMYLGGYTFSLD